MNGLKKIVGNDIMAPKIEDLNAILDRINQWIVNCDNKSMILVTLMGIIVGILFATSYIGKLLNIYSYICLHLTFFNLFYLMISIFSISLILVGIWYIIQSFVAKTEIPTEEGLITNSLIYYSTISDYEYGDYVKNVKCLDEESLKQEIISQIYINSKICTKKFENYNKGLKFSIWGFSLFAVSMVIGCGLCKLVWGI